MNYELEILNELEKYYKEVEEIFKKSRESNIISKKNKKIKSDLNDNKKSWLFPLSFLKFYQNLRKKPKINIEILEIIIVCLEAKNKSIPWVRKKILSFLSTMGVMAIGILIGKVMETEPCLAFIFIFIIIGSSMIIFVFIDLLINRKTIFRKELIKNLKIIVSIEKLKS